MRLTTEEILKMYPSMWMSGNPAHRETVVGRYYGDLPYANGEPVSPVPKYGALDEVDSFVAACYLPEKVYKYSFCHGGGFMTESGRVICGTLTIPYGNREFGYDLSLFNNHCGINGFCLWVSNAGTITVDSYFTPGYRESADDNIRKVTKKEIPAEEVHRIFNKVKTDDTYGYFAQELIKVAENIME